LILLLIPLDHGTGDGVFEGVEQAGPISGEGFGNFDELFDSGLECILTPCFEKCLGSIPILFVPEDSELLLHGMNDEERLVDLEQCMEASSAVGFEILVVAKKQKAIPLESLLAEIVELPLLFSAPEGAGRRDRPVGRTGMRRQPESAGGNHNLRIRGDGLPKWMWESPEILWDFK
jgi:hypothetical protein